LTGAGVTGILLIAAGSYVLNLAEVRRGLLAPLRAIAREPGSRSMIAVALIYSITATLGKQAIAASSPLFFGVVYSPLLALLLTPLVLRKAGGEITGALRDGTLRAVLAPGLWYALVTVTHVLAMSLTQVAYMIAVKRTSLLFGVLYGHLMFREPGFRERPVGALLMLAGVGMIVAGG
jgi:drug/metabolite transporter (DMT)-like permease